MTVKFSDGYEKTETVNDRKGIIVTTTQPRVIAGPGNA